MRFVEVSVPRVAEQVIDVPEVVSRVMKDDGQEQIVQMVKVISPERPSERVVEEIGGCIPRQMEEETENVVQIFPQDRGQTLEEADDFLVQRFIPQDCVQEQMVQVDRAMPQERLLEQQVAKEIREVITYIVTAREETLELLKFSKEGCAGSGLDFVLQVEEITQDPDPEVFEVDKFARQPVVCGGIGGRMSLSARIRCGLHEPLDRVFHCADFSLGQHPRMDEACATAEKPLRRIPAVVVRERNWHFAKQREHAIEISTFTVVALKPCDLPRPRKGAREAHPAMPQSTQCQHSFVLQRAARESCSIRT